MTDAIRILSSSGPGSVLTGCSSVKYFFCLDLRQRQTHQNHRAGSSAAHRTISLSLGLSLAAGPAVNQRFRPTGTTCSWTWFGSKEVQHCVKPVGTLGKLVLVLAVSAGLQSDLPEGSAALLSSWFSGSGRF